MSLPSEFKDRRICIIGLGYVGLTLGVAMADRGFKVHGVEVRDEVLDLLKRKRAHFWEPRLDEKLVRGIDQGNFSFSKSLDGVGAQDVYIVTVGTPLGKDGHARIDMVTAATNQVRAHMVGGELVILRSTVKLGTARDVVKPLLDATNLKYELAFCPERTLEGRALIELYELPQVIGADDAGTRLRCMQLFSLMTPTTIALPSFESAELVKLVDNTYRDLTFGFANEIAKLCARMGISAYDVIRAGKLGYARTNVALPGPVGGPCLEKDPHILVESAKAWGVDLPVTRAGRLTNEQQPEDIARILGEWVTGRPGFSERLNISLLGLAFKGVPATDDLRGTMALPIYDQLKRRFPNANFKGYDPVVGADAAREIFDFPMVPTPQEAFEQADVVLILNNHNQFRDMDLGALIAGMRRPGIIYDLWNLHHEADKAIPPEIVYLALGNERLPEVKRGV